MKEDKLYEDIKYELIDLKTALIVGGYHRSSDRPLCIEHLDELEELSKTYGFDVVGKEPCSIRKIDPATFLGKGKVEEFLCVGKNWKDVVTKLPKVGKYFDTKDELLKYLKDKINSESVILVKGSRSAGMDFVSDKLKV